MISLSRLFEMKFKFTGTPGGPIKLKHLNAVKNNNNRRLMSFAKPKRINIISSVPTIQY